MNVDASFWNRIAERYAQQPVADPAAFDRKIAITRSNMSPSSVVLDAGCGTGSLVLRLASAGAHVHGLDVSSEMIRIARERASAAGSSNVTFHEGAVDERAPFAAGSLDGVCFYSLLHLLADRPAALGLASRWLKPGGFFVASTTCLGESWLPYAPLLTVMRWLGRAPRVWMLTKAGLADEVRAAGFVSVEEPEIGAASTLSFLVARKPG